MPIDRAVPCCRALFKVGVAATTLLTAETVGAQTPLGPPGLSGPPPIYSFEIAPGVTPRAPGRMPDHPDFRFELSDGPTPPRLTTPLTTRELYEKFDRVTPPPPQRRDTDVLELSIGDRRFQIGIDTMASERQIDAAARDLFASDPFRLGDRKAAWEALYRASIAEGVADFLVLLDRDTAAQRALILDPNTLLERASPTSLGRLFLPKTTGVEPFQVAPGTEGDGGGGFAPPAGNGNGTARQQAARGVCADRYCGAPSKQEIGRIPLDAEGRSVITYVSAAFDEVIALQPGLTPLDPNEPTRCTATRVAKHWAITALHCFVRRNNTYLGIPGRSVREQFNWSTATGAAGWIVGSPKTNVWWGLAQLESGIAKGALIEKVYLNFADEFGITWVEGSQPPNDIALVRFDGTKLREPDRYATLAFVDEAVTDAPVSFFGYGYTDATFNGSRYDWISDKLGSYNWINSVGRLDFSWWAGTLGGNGGPCLGDSGGPVYSGWDRGYSLDLAASQDRKALIGIVSFLKVPGLITEATAERCRSGPGVATLVSAYKPGLCRVAGGVLQGC